MGFLKITLISAVIFLAAAGGLNFIVDPYVGFGNNQLGVEDFDVYVERRYKAHLLGHHPTNGIIFGSSKATRIDPTQLAPYPFINAAYHAAVPEEIRYFVDRFSHKRPFVVLSLDLFMFSESNFGYIKDPASRLKTDPWATLFSFDALSASARTIFSQALGTTKIFLPNGQYNTAERERASRILPTYEDSYWLDILRNINYRDFTYSPRRIDDVRESIAILEARGVPHLITINPLSLPVQKLLVELKIDDDLSRLRADLRQISPHFVDLSVGPLSKRENFFKDDPFHFRSGIVETSYAAAIKARD